MLPGAVKRSTINLETQLIAAPGLDISNTPSPIYRDELIVVALGLCLGLSFTHGKDEVFYPARGAKRPRPPRVARGLLQRRVGGRVAPIISVVNALVPELCARPVCLA